MKHFGFINEAHHGKSKTTRTNTATATTRKSPGQICVSPAEKTAKTTQNGAGAIKEKPQKCMGIASRHDRVKPTVSLFFSLVWPSSKARSLHVKKQVEMKSSTPVVMQYGKSTTQNKHKQRSPSQTCVSPSSRKAKSERGTVQQKQPQTKNLHGHSGHCVATQENAPHELVATQ